MASVMFSFDEDTPEEVQNKVGCQVMKLPGVRNVGRISPTSTKSSIRRLWFAEVADEQAAGNILVKLRQNNEIKSADIPAARGVQ